jgi:hypothetical protein
VRDGESGAITHVVVLATLGAPERGRRASRSRPRGRAVASADAAAPVATGRAMIITTARPLGDADAARTWLRTAGEAELADSLAVLGRVLQAQRIATADPYVAPVGRDALIGARVGFGSGTELAEGRFGEARELSAPGRTGVGPARPGGLRRRRALVPAARLAGLLAGREAALACEELALRARLDLDGGRPREAALQLLVALDAALAELPADPHGPALSERIAELRGRREAVAAAAQAALSGAPSADAQATVADTVARLEAALRARAASVG